MQPIVIWFFQPNHDWLKYNTMQTTSRLPILNWLMLPMFSNNLRLMEIHSMHNKALQKLVKNRSIIQKNANNININKNFTTM